MKKACLFIFSVIFSLCFTVFTPYSFSAERYPDKPIQLIIPYVAGAVGDITARMLADEMEKALNGKIIPNNKPGASTLLGIETALRAKRDGYTLVYAGASATVFIPNTNPELIKFDPVKDLEPLGFHYVLPSTITVKKDSEWKTFAELIAYAKKNPGKLRVSTMGKNSQPHFTLEVIQALTGTEFTHVPFEGGESVITALLGGHVEVTCDAYSKVKPHADAGKLRILLTTNKIAAEPKIPTITELGYKQNLPTTWFGLFAPAGIPEEARKALVPAVEKAVKATKDRIDKMGSLCNYKSPAEMRKLIDEQYKQISGVAKKMGIGNK
jgi:tripartite-type tricarboxylate transporter receptor subunit TctC